MSESSPAKKTVIETIRELQQQADDSDRAFAARLTSIWAQELGIEQIDPTLEAADTAELSAYRASVREAIRQQERETADANSLAESDTIQRALARALPPPSDAPTVSPPARRQRVLVHANLSALTAHELEQLVPDESISYGAPMSHFARRLHEPGLLTITVDVALLPVPAAEALAAYLVKNAAKLGARTISLQNDHGITYAFNLSDGSWEFRPAPATFILSLHQDLQAFLSALGVRGSAKEE